VNLAWNSVRVVVVAVVVVAVAEVSRRYPRVGAVLLSLPLVSLLAFLASWFQHHDLQAITKLSRETLVLVPLGLPFFVPLALAPRLGWGFWPCFGAGIALATLTILAWLAWGPEL
jgi:hypothetical protein